MLTNSITKTSNRFNDRTFAKFLSKGVDMDLERFSTGLGSLSPDQRKDLLVGKSPIGMTHEDAQDNKLLVGERNEFSIEPNFMAGHIDHQPVKLGLLERKRFVADCFILGAAKDNTDS